MDMNVCGHKICVCVCVCVCVCESERERERETEIENTIQRTAKPPAHLQHHYEDDKMRYNLDLLATV
jgi:hypothetical protein